MKTYRLRTMWGPVLVYYLGLILWCEAQTLCNTHSTFRAPLNSDIKVTCGTDYMEMSIFLCPVYFGGYNSSLMALNAQFSTLDCRGIPDWTVDPPILKFNLSITANAMTLCKNNFRLTSEVGTGVFADFSNIQYVNISGIINSLDPSAGTITYRQQIMYLFSCRYPLQYLVNNTEVAVSGVSLAVRDNNGSFVSTLSMKLYSDANYTQSLIVPDTGINLKTRIFVVVKATNLTERFNVMLDRCYATTSPFPTNSTYYDLFVGCTRDGQIKVDVNGVSQKAYFSFEAFRFVQHKNMTVSTFYLHCVTRLCEVSTCQALLPNCSATARRRRDATANQDVSADNVATVSAGPIMTRVDNGSPEGAAPYSASTQSEGSSMVAVAVIIAVLVVISLAMAVFIGLAKRRKWINIH
ncbi:zona pellucida-like domain-containing protein 1 [Hypomesus transpacificus]|uniref:zona pellucida-like domain-containing protein 1 n=1 Tax=Hypomesus transpacificus TaxID=137520 RepID=UPI001F0818F6|nr:zona pellucida-like domain-containing protein 1 [Hypomesus transpacificus]